MYNLTNDIQGIDRINRLLKEYREHQNDNLHKSVMNLIVSANKEIFEEANGSMCEALYELMKDQIEEQVEERVKQQVGEEVKKTIISLVKDGLLSIADAAKRLSISEEECVRAMEMTEV